MVMKRRDFNKLLLGAVGGIVAGSVMGCESDDQPTESSSGAASCKGTNECKGKGGCKTDANSCKGQNACKGKGGCKAG